MSNAPVRRCSRHDLAVAPDGQCVLCRREQSPAGVAAVPQVHAPGESSGPSVGLVGVALIVLVAGAGAYAWSSSRSTSRPIAGNPASQLKAAVKPLDEDPAETDRLKADDLAKSLAMLDQAEGERVALEHAEAERARSTEAAEQKLAEEMRDQQRRQQIQQDLEQTALTAARRNVRITMYSTTWCPSCTKARAYMEAQAIPFTEHDVDRDSSARTRQKQLNPKGSVPTISIDDELLIGFGPEALEYRIAKAARKRRGS